MAWLRIGDTFATDPRILVLNDPHEPLLGPACRGFFLELATLSAAQSTDYVISPGWISLAGGIAAQQLLKRCIRAGLITDLGGKGAGRRWKLIDDAPELIHIRLRDEIAWEKQQKTDTRDRALQIPVLLRDGDACRWCGVPVQPNDNRSRRGRTFDHLRPGQPARGPQDLVVACRGCNGKRGRDWRPDDDTGDSFAARWAPQLRPAPIQLFFVRSTVAFLEGEGHPVPAGSVIADRADPARDTAGTTQTSGPDATHPVTQARVAAPARSTTPPADQHPTGVAATGEDTSATRPASPARAAAHPAADPHPTTTGVAATADSNTAPECTQHPASQAGVAASESRDHRTPTDRSGTAPPGRVGTGRVGPGGSSPARASPGHPPDPPSPPVRTPAPRRTRRGRRSPRPPRSEEHR